MTQVLEAIVGLQWGDEGKGKIVDERVKRIKDNSRKKVVVVRYQGGPNAGHTITIPRKKDSIKFVAHAAPSGIANNADIAIGPSVAFDPEKFMQEYNLAKETFHYSGRVLISERTGVLLEHHRIVDAYQESNGRKIGTTKSGIGPFYQDNANRRTRITFADYVSPQFPNKLRSIFEIKKQELLAAEVNLDSKIDEIIAKHDPIRKKLSEFSENLEDTLYEEYLTKGNHIIIEGAQGTMLDVDMGTIPDVTSSHLLAPNAFASLGLPRRKFNIIGVEKIYPTRVGEGILPTLSLDGFGEEVAKEAHEVGATTGRIRRVGYPDWVIIRRSIRLNECDGIILTRADNVQDKEIKVCTQYTVDNKETIKVPLDLERIQKPMYANKSYRWHLWNLPSDEVHALTQLRAHRRHYVLEGKRSLPQNLIHYIKKHDKFVKCKTIGVSIGPERGDTVYF